MTYLCTPPYYPQSNGKLKHYNNERLHRDIGFVAPLDMLLGRAHDTWGARDERLEAAREHRQLARCSTADPNASVASPSSLSCNAHLSRSRCAEQWHVSLFGRARR
jgi:hypothetical protein